MSAVATAGAQPRNSSWALRRRQAWTVARLETGRSLFAWRSVWLLLLTFAPAVIIGAHALHDRDHNLEEETLILAWIVQAFYMRVGIFFGCLGVFTRLIRGEVVERTLHYPFLAPLRREVLLVGKFVAGTVITVAIFGAGVLASFALMYAHSDAGRDFVRNGPGLAHLGAYLLVTALACLGYGAVFLALSVLFRNPILPSVVFLLWEQINGALPVWLKHLSVTFYLKPLCPVELPVEGMSGLFTVVAEPTPTWLAVTGLITFAALVVVFACRRIRHFEVSYTTE
jgi:hypothetical protein